MGEWLKDKVAIVTGSGGGIGRGIALDFSAQGAKVVILMQARSHKLVDFSLVVHDSDPDTKGILCQGAPLLETQGVGQVPVTDFRVDDIVVAGSGVGVGVEFQNCMRGIFDGVIVQKWGTSLRFTEPATPNSSARNNSNVFIGLILRNSLIG